MINFSNNINMIYQTKTNLGKQQKERLTQILKCIVSHKLSDEFRRPVDYQALNLPNYPSIIKHPMDLGTVQKNLDQHRYTKVEKCLSDIQLIWMNCKAYNPSSHPIVSRVRTLETFANKMIKNYLPFVKVKVNQNSRVQGSSKKEAKEEKLQRKAEVGLNHDLLLETNEKEGKYDQKLQQPKQLEVISLSPLQNQLDIKKVKIVEDPAVNTQDQNDQRSEEKETSSKQSEQNNFEIDLLPIIQSFQYEREDYLATEQNCENKFKKQFIQYLRLCNYGQVAKIYLYFERNCPSSISYKLDGRTSINLKDVKNGTLMNAIYCMKKWVELDKHNTP